MSKKGEFTMEKQNVNLVNIPSNSDLGISVSVGIHPNIAIRCSAAKWAG